jgi:O-antigen/teichoic acid export membrane protein
MPTSARHATRQRAASDILMQVLVRIGNLALGVLVTALVVRTLGENGYGQWSTILVVLGLIGYFINFGMEEVAIREAARDPGSEHEWIGAVILLRLFALVPVVLVSVAAILVLHRSHQMLIAGLVLVIGMPFGGIGALGLLFQLRVDNRVPMLVLTLRSVLWAIAVAVIYWRGGSMIALAIAMAATNSLAAIVQLLAVFRLDTPWPRPSRKQLAPLIRVGLPVGIAGALVVAYARIDQVIVFVIAGTKPAGLYGSVYNVLDQGHFVPISILTTLSPVLAAAWPADRAKLLRTARLTAQLLAIASFGALAFAAVASGPVVRLVFGREFSHAASALPVLAGAFVLICFGYLNGNLLLVFGLQKRLLWISLVALVANIAGNLIAVPLAGFMGAAWITLATEAVVFLLTLRLILQTLEMRRPKVGRIGHTALAAIVLGGALEAIKLAGAPLGVLFAAFCFGYPALLFGLRAVVREDLGVLLRRGSPG